MNPNRVRVTTHTNYGKYKLEWDTHEAEFIARHPDWPALIGFGDTHREAIRQLDIAIKASIEIHKENNYPLPAGEENE